MGFRPPPAPGVIAIGNARFKFFQRVNAIDPIPKSTNRPLVVITKNMARNLSPSLFQEWMKICDGVVWSIRDPRIQLASLVTRIANDLAYEPGADSIAQENLSNGDLKAVSDFLENGPVSKNFSKTSWADIGEHFRSGFQPKQSVVIDGGELTTKPKEILKNACDVLGLQYNPQMIEGWQGDFINANTGYNSKLTDTTHAWTKEAATTHGIIPISRPALNIDSLPIALREHITQVALPIYEEMIASSE